MKATKFGALKRIRVYVSLLFFIAFAALFLDPWHFIPIGAGNFLTGTQFIPSLLKVVVYNGLISICLFVILVLTVTLGRVYCSSICPLGTLQDIVIYIAKKIQKRKRFSYQKPPFFFHYLVLALIATFLIGGSMTLLNLVEPFSNFGRIFTNLAEPVAMVMNNQFSQLLERFGVFFLYNIPMREISIVSLLLPLIFLGSIVYLSARHGRFFCNSLCPAGALLGILSRISIFKIAIEAEACNECGACERVCKSNCIDVSRKHIDYAACVNCYNCIRSCPKAGVVFRNTRSNRISNNQPQVNQARRSLMKETLPKALLLALPAYATTESLMVRKSGFEENGKHPIVPPGSQTIGRFTNLCTACHLCVNACPSRVLYPSFLEFGAAGIFQPRMKYTAGYCGYDCTICGQVCPSGAILPLSIDEKKLTQIGKANFNRDDCIVVTKKQDCAACSEHCPTKAVHTIPYEGKLSVPELSPEYCIGCGACEHACPVKPRKAIYVVANSVHQVAKKPVEKKLQKGFDSSQEFPF